MLIDLGYESCSRLLNSSLVVCEQHIKIMNQLNLSLLDTSPCHKCPLKLSPRDLILARIVLLVHISKCLDQLEEDIQ